jgi:hypothetical protein
MKQPASNKTTNRFYGLRNQCSDISVVSKPQHHHRHFEHFKSTATCCDHLTSSSQKPVIIYNNEQPPRPQPWLLDPVQIGHQRYDNTTRIISPNNNIASVVKQLRVCEANNNHNLCYLSYGGGQQHQHPISQSRAQTHSLPPQIT